MKSKKILIYLLLCIVAKTSLAQKSITNAYYLSKVLVTLNDPIFRRDSSLKANGNFKTILDFIDPTGTLRWSNDSTLLKDKKEKISYKNIVNLVNTIEISKSQKAVVALKYDSIFNNKLNNLTITMQNKEDVEKGIEKWKNTINNLINRDSIENIQIAHLSLKLSTEDIKYFFGKDSIIGVSSAIEFNKSVDSLIQKRNNLTDINAQIERINGEIMKIKQLIDEARIWAGTASERLENKLYKAPSKVYNDGTIYVSIENNSTEKTLSSTNVFKMPDESEIIDALAIFVANRFKEELTLTFIEELKYQIRNEESVKALFPYTLESLENLKGYKLPSIGDNIFLSLAKDVINMDASLLKLKKFPQEFLVVLAEINQFTLRLEKGQHFEGVIEITDNVLFDTSSLFKKIIHTIRVLNDNFKSYDGQSFYMRYDDIMNMGNIEFEYFIALLANHEPFFMKFLADNEFTPKSNNKDFNTIRNKLGSMLLALENFENSINNVQGKERNLAVGQSLVSLFKEADNIFQISNSRTKQSLNIIEHMFEIFRHKMKGDFKPVLGHIVEIIKICTRPKAQNTIEQLTAYCKKGEDIYNFLDSLTKVSLPSQSGVPSKFVDVIIASDFFSKYSMELNIVDSLDKKMIESEIEELKNIVVKMKGLSNITYETFLLDPIIICVEIYDIIDKMGECELIKNEYFSSLKKDITNDLQAFFKAKNEEYLIVEKLVRVGGFATDVLKAKNSSELANVFKAYAAPINSYKIKRSTRNSWSINAFVGLYCGAEDNWTVKNEIYGNFGITVPIGVTYSWAGRRKLSKASEDAAKWQHNVFMGKCGSLKVFNGWAKSVTISLVDITAPFIYRFTQGEDGGLSRDIKFEQIFSPGLIFSFHIPRQPLCINIGAQLTPRLSDMNDVSKNTDAMRYSLGIAFDIPLFQISQRDSFD